jgi:hypothetical protein
VNENLSVATPETPYDAGQDADALKFLQAAIEAAQTQSRGKAEYPEVPKYTTEDWTPLSRLVLTHRKSENRVVIDEYQQQHYPCDRLTEVWRTNDIRRVNITPEDAQYVRLSSGVGTHSGLRPLDETERRGLAQFIEESV